MEVVSVSRKPTAILATNARAHGFTKTLVTSYGGRILQVSGTFLLSEFPRVVDAVECARVIQKVLKADNERLAPQRRVPFRIGIEVGDVTIAGDVMSPDGAMLPSGLDALAEPGEICISARAYEQIATERALAEDALAHRLGSAESMRVYHGGAAPLPASERPLLTDPPASAPSREAPTSSRGRLAVVAATLAAVVAVVGLAAWQLTSPDGKPPVVAAAVSRPTLAVLPVVNMSGDPRGDRVAAQIDGAVRANLSGLSGLVTTAASTNTRYVLDTSIRRVDGRLRLVATLVDTTTGHAVVADRFDRPIIKVAALQRDLVQWVVTALGIPVKPEDKSSRETAYADGARSAGANALPAAAVTLPPPLRPVATAELPPRRMRTAPAATSPRPAAPRPTREISQQAN